MKLQINLTNISGEFILIKVWEKYIIILIEKHEMFI